MEVRTDEESGRGDRQDVSRQGEREDRAGAHLCRMRVRRLVCDKHDDGARGTCEDGSAVARPRAGRGDYVSYTTTTEIAEALGVTEQAVRAACKRLVGRGG